VDSPVEESGFEPLVPLNLRRGRFSEHLFGLPGTHVAPSERWRSGWDHEFESPLLQQRVCQPSVPLDAEWVNLAERI
jgi:hypothetical protein